MSVAECGVVIVGSVRIITGAGSHSVGGRSRLKPAVERALQKGIYRYESSGSGELTCMCHIFVITFGCVTLLTSGWIPMYEIVFMNTRR
jgi:hypothetical protein